MSAIINISRREFCQASAVLAGGLVLAFSVPGCKGKVEEAAPPGPFVPNASSASVLTRR